MLRKWLKDRRKKREIVRMLEEMNARGLTIVLVTHDPIIAEHAQRTLFMRDGRITESPATGATEAQPGATAQ